MFNQEDSESRFFVRGDKKSQQCYMTFPADWWSRWYEYTWGMQFAEEGDTCLDVACGIPHPFKFYLASQCKEVYGCDLDPAIQNNQTILQGVRGYFSEEDTAKAASVIDQIQFKYLDVALLEDAYEKESFHKIYCLSALEHMPLEVVEQALQGFYTTLKPGGLVVLTIDVPSMPIDFIIKTAEAKGFRLVGSVDTTLPKDAIYSTLLGGLYCFRILLTK